MDARIVGFYRGGRKRYSVESADPERLVPKEIRSPRAYSTVKEARLAAAIFNLNVVAVEEA